MRHVCTHNEAKPDSKKAEITFLGQISLKAP
jgi:hypothetical protein